jgi:purine-binding chemotaxis protein CheW
MQHPVNGFNPEEDRTGSSPGGPARQYLRFELAGQEYGIEIMRVQEIRSAERATRIPNTPEHVLGVINLRGHIVPVVDLRRRFGLPASNVQTSQVTVVVRVPVGERDVTAGLLVDSVSEVCSLETAALQPAPQLRGGEEAQFVASLAVSARGLVILLDVSRLIDASLFTSLDQQVA